MRDGVGVPAFGEHGYRHHTPDGFAKTALFAHGVHDFPEQLLVGKVLGLLAVSRALDDLGAKTVDLVGGHVAEVLIQRLTGAQLLASPKNRIGLAVLVAM